MSLSSLPLDILLPIFQHLDITDVFRVGMTCKDLYQATRDRHVWVDWLDKLRQKDPALRLATPPLTSLSAQELKTLATSCMKMRLRWCNVLYFAAKGLVGIPGICNIMLLPGGNSLLIIDNRGGVTLRRVKMEDSEVSLPVVANIEPDQNVTFGPGRRRLLTTMTPCPMLIHTQGMNGSNVQIIRVDHHNSAMSLETTFCLPEGFGFLKADGQGRVIGFLVQKPLEPPRAIIIHLDHPGFIVESEISHTYSLEGEYVSYLWNICVPTENLAVIHNAECILACKIPRFSSLSPGVNHTNATEMWSWSGLSSIDPNLRFSLSSIAGEVLYDPLSAQEFNLYYVSRGLTSQVNAVTIPINITDHDLVLKSTEPPVLEQKSTIIETDAKDPEMPFCRNGLYFDKYCEDVGIHFYVIPLKAFAMQDSRGILGIFLSHKELEQTLQMIEIDMDEVTGRVLVWGWEKEAQETRIFIGDLV